MEEPRIRLLSGDFYVDDARDSYAWMRVHAPVYFDETSDLWAVSTYAGVLAVGRDARTFSSAGGSRPDTGPMPWMIDMDAPDHLKRRKLVSRGFTPARVRDTMPRVTAICDELIDSVCERGECDLVAELAAPLPMIVIGDMLGVPPEDRAALLRWSDDMLRSLGGDEAGIAAVAHAFGEFQEYATRMIAKRRAEPTEDLVSVLVHAEVDGADLEEHEILFETLLLLIGGDETTRQVTSGGMEQLLAHPDQRQWLRADPALLPSAVEEMLRWVTPIKNMHRTVTREVVLEGQPLQAGDRVLLLYESANFDETHFTAAEQFDITRAPNDHLAFGFGAHVCLGVSLARVELQCIVGRLLERLPDLEHANSATPPRTLTGITSMPVRFSPVARVVRFRTVPGMESRFVGSTGLKVSVFALGTMGFGGGDQSPVGDIDARTTRRMVAASIDAGVNLFDTANSYSGGRAEAMLGDVLEGKRYRVLISTKVHARTGDGLNDVGQSRWNIIQSCNTSLQRLRTDHIDFFHVHGFDGCTAPEESLRVLDQLVRDGKVRALACSNYAAWQIAQAIGVSQRLGLDQFVAAESYYSLIGRDLEWDVIPACRAHDLGVFVWSPLAGGLLSGKFTRDETPGGTRRAMVGDLGIGPVDEARAWRVIDAGNEIAGARGVSLAQVALNWVRANASVSSVIIGARTMEQLSDNLATAEWSLTEAECKQLDEASAAPLPYPHWFQRQFTAERYSKAGPPDPTTVYKY